MTEKKRIFPTMSYYVVVTILALLIGLWMYPSEIASIAFTTAIIGAFFAVEVLIPGKKQKMFFKAIFAVFFVVVSIMVYVNA